MLLLNKETGEQREADTGKAWYLAVGFLPYVGLFIFPILAIVRKQFKMAVLTPWAWMFIPGSIMFYFTFYSETVTMSIVIFQIIMTFFLVVFNIIFIIYANKWSMKMYLERGFEPVNITLPEQDIVKEAADSEIPWWVLFR